MKKILFPILAMTLNIVHAQVPEKNYAKFDFIPGEQLLFEDHFISEQSDEIPSYWIVPKGKVETAKIDGEMVMAFLDGTPSAYPRMKPAKTLLSDRYTLEFDYLWRNNSKPWIKAVGDGNAGGDRLQIQFANDQEWEAVKDKLGDFENNIVITSSGQVEFKEFKGTYKTGTVVDANQNLYEDLCDKWVHISIAVTEKSLKVYLNSERVLNAQIQAGGNGPSFQILADGSTYEYSSQLFIKNVKVAAGGADPYKTLMTDGKIIARGINFDVAKSIIKPESFGALNNILAIMKEHPELKFEIGGHTDSDGEDATNLKLSQERADAVEAKLISMGIAATRLTSKGYGETKPIGDNTVFEGKATNRRVEFVKQ
jgi:OmpA-OmpF porin, OOP family